MARYRVTVAGKNYDEMADLVRKYKLNIAGHTGKKAASGRYVVDLFADSDQIATLKSVGYGVDVHEDVQEAGTRRQAEVRSFARTGAAPASSVATSNHYLNVDDIETRPSRSSSRCRTRRGKGGIAMPSRSPTATRPAGLASSCSAGFMRGNGAARTFSSTLSSSSATPSARRAASPSAA